MPYLRKTKIKATIFAAISIIAAIGAFYNDAGKDIYVFIKKQINPYSEAMDKLSKINVGQNIEYIDSLFGKAAIIRKLPTSADSQYTFVLSCDSATSPKAVNLSKYTERIYVNDLYYIQLITDVNKSVVFYSVTTRVKNFNPPLPSCFMYSKDGKQLYLGKTHFSDYELLSLVSYYSDGSGMHSLYEEQYYFIRVNKYCFLSQSSVGYEFTKDIAHETIMIRMKYACSDSNDKSRFGFNGTLTNRFQRNAWAGEIMMKITPPDIIAIRSVGMPNTYAVGEEGSHDDLMRYLFQSPSGIGPDYDLARELNF